MARKRKTNYPFAGRPPVDPLKRIGTPVRALVTDQIADLLARAARMHGIPDPERGKVASDIVRLYLYYGLEREGLLDDEIQEDPTWKTLHQRGLI